MVLATGVASDATVRGHRADECWNAQIHTVIDMPRITDRDEAFRLRAAMLQDYLLLFDVELDELGENTLRNRTKRQKCISRKKAARVRRAEVDVSLSAAPGPLTADTSASHFSAATDGEEQVEGVTAFADLQTSLRTRIEGDKETKGILRNPKGEYARGSSSRKIFKESEGCALHTAQQLRPSSKEEHAAARLDEIARKSYHSDHCCSVHGLWWMLCGLI